MTIQEAVEKFGMDGRVMVRPHRRAGRQQTTHRKVTYRNGVPGVTVDRFWRELRSFEVLARWTREDRTGEEVLVVFEAPALIRRRDGSIWGETDRSLWGER